VVCSGAMVIVGLAQRKEDVGLGRAGTVAASVDSCVGTDGVVGEVVGGRVCRGVEMA
jgi:hypothetical protein